MGLNFFYTIILFVSLCCQSFGQIGDPKNDPLSKPSIFDPIIYSGIDSLFLKGELNFGLTGAGQKLTVWEAELNGYPKLNNPLIDGKWLAGDSQAGFSEHANSLAELLFSNINSKGFQGIAPQSQAVFFNTDNFWQEFAENCPQINLSLHPYALNPGWQNFNAKNGKLFWSGLEEVSKKEDYNFGFYSHETRLWDSILCENPFHLAIKSAGNSRGEQGEGLHFFYRSKNNSTSDYFLDSSSTTRQKDGADMGYDCLPAVSVSKNLLVIGALKMGKEAQNLKKEFIPQKDSPFGPTDDGRIKPDLMAFGEKTSQSAAFVAGATLLVNEQYLEVFKEPASAFMLKCILIHTADELGKYKGPDYKMGWGLINANKAVKLVSQPGRNLIQGNLKNGDSLRYFVRFKKGKNCKVTLVWNDPQGSPLEFRNDPNMLNSTKSMLVNDLDLKITELVSGCSLLPFVLNPLRPDLPAKNGVNSLDNVESLIWELPYEGWYEIEIRHKGELKGGSQDFALAISNLEYGFAFDGKNWFPHKPNELEHHYPILILKGGKNLEKKEIEKFQNVSFE